MKAAHGSTAEPAIPEGQMDSSRAPVQTPVPPSTEGKDRSDSTRDVTVANPATGPALTTTIETITEWADETANDLPAEHATPVEALPKAPLVPDDIRRPSSTLGGTTPSVSEQAGIDPCSGPGLAAALTAQTTSGLLKAFGDISLAAGSITRLDEKLRNSVVSDHPMNSEFLAQLHSHARTLGKLSRNLALLAETSVIGRLSEMAGPPQSHIYGLLGSLRDALGDIVRKVDADNTDPKQLLWRTAEECLRQATEPSGTVHIETALTVEETHNISAMYRADRGLPADEDNSMSSKVPSGPKQLGESWVAFWTQVLDKCPGGPTLFNPATFGPSGSNMSYMFPFSTDVPRYLYRVVESSRSGGDNLDLAASEMWLSMWLSSGDQPGQAGPDLLSLDPDVAAKKLIHHLAGWHSQNDDNLVSWSSSLKHALQSAICRFEDSRVHKFDFNHNISVCVVDTTRFPTRQFARDRWLLRVYRDTEVARDMGRYYDALLDDQSVYNGEFFSQGMVDVKGRSSTCRLFRLEFAGIKELYPELYNHPPGLLRHACDYRVTELRRQWSTRCKSTTEDIERAVAVAEKFGAPIDSMEVAIQLLAFKNRRIFKRSSRKPGSPSPCANR
jgi:hypothetical protein